MRKIILLVLLIVASFLLYKFEIIRIPLPKDRPLETLNKTDEPFLFKANIQYIKGFAWNIVEGRKIELKEDDILVQGSEIQTEKDTFVVFSLDDGSVIRIGPETKIKLTDLISNNILIENINGNIFSRVNKDKDHLFTVLADDVRVKALGTVFSVENSDSVKVSVYESSVVIDSENVTDTQVTESNKWEESSQKVSKITATDLTENKLDSWGLEEEKITTKLNTESKEEPKKDETLSGISLSGKSTELGVYLEWVLKGVSGAEGIKILKSSEKNPTFPEDGYVYVKELSTNHYTLTLKDGKNWHFRVCAYSGGTCILYSNDIEVTAPEGNDDFDKDAGEVKSISLKIISVDDDEVKLSWTVDGRSEKGYKLVYSKKDKPTYPLGDGDKYIYNSDPDDKDVTVDNLSDGKYYFRVCEYLGGKCGVYSNQVSVEIE